MKKLNCTSEFAEERSTFLRRAFRDAIARQSVIDAHKAFHIAAETPAPRFWVSEVRAAAVVGKLMQGVDVLQGMFPKKRAMFEEIYRRFTLLKEQRPNASIAELMVEIVNQPAPGSYLSPEHVRRLTRRPR